MGPFQRKKQKVSGFPGKRLVRRKKRRYICAGIAAMLLAGSLFTGCSVKEGNDTKVSDLEYTIVEDADLPEELLAMIEEKKAADFKLSHETGGELYIVRGYGEQDTGGYSIGIQSFYLTVNAIVFDTELVGPRKGETVSKSPSYPYIVIKLPFREENIIFE